MVTQVDQITADVENATTETFNAQAVLSWSQLKISITQKNAQANEVNALADEAAASAASAASSVAALADTEWASGSFTEGDVRWSPISFLSYRAKTTGSLTIDPSLDEPNWQQIPSVSEEELHAAALYF